jgi:hypothetical protein
VTIYVGAPEQTAAHYVLNDQEEVGAFLSKIARVLDDR